jgi:hypothetical protein
MQVLSAGGGDEPQGNARAGDEWQSLPVDMQPMAPGGKDVVASLCKSGRMQVRRHSSLSPGRPGHLGGVISNAGTT